MLWNSPSTLLFARGIETRGRDTVADRFKAYYEGTWHLEPDMSKFHVAVISNEVMQVLVPIVPPRSLQQSLLRRGATGRLRVQLMSLCRGLGLRVAGHPLQLWHALRLEALGLPGGLEKPLGLVEAGGSSRAGAHLIQRRFSVLEANGRRSGA